MAQLTLPLVSVATGLSSSLYISGLISSLSILTTSGILAMAPLPPRSLAIAWNAYYTRGFQVMPATCVASGLVNLYAAWACRSAGLEWRGSLASGLLMIAVLPFTVLVMMDTNNAIKAVAEGKAAAKKEGGGGGEGEDEVRRLMHRWNGMNLSRALLPLTAFASGAWNLVQVVHA